MSELSLTVNGQERSVADRGQSLLGLLREDLGVGSVKDGCSPQGQCGCCTVLVDGKPRVACVTPARRVRGRVVTTLEGLDEEVRDRWADAFCATGASQCGFCTPGIVMRLEGSERPVDRDGVDSALLAHLCRCTGWQTIREAAALVGTSVSIETGGRDLEAASRRATIEGRAPQQVGPRVALGQGGFIADLADPVGLDGVDSLVAVMAADGSWVVGETLDEARKAAGKVQGRRTTVDHGWPVDLPEPADGASGRVDGWSVALRTTWVEPAYLEPDAAWCEPGGEPRSGAANGGAFGAKDGGGDEALGLEAELAATARRLADEYGRPVLVLASREDVTRLGAKRPPMALAVDGDGVGVARVVATEGIAEVIESYGSARGLTLSVTEVTVPGPSTSVMVRAAGWAEVAIVAAALAGPDADGGFRVESPDGAVATARVEAADPGQQASPSGARIMVSVSCGEPLDEVVLRSYCIGAAHMAWSWLTSESLTVDLDGVIGDLTIRSFGVTRSVDTPPIEVVIQDDSGPAINGSDAVFAAVAAATWAWLGHPQELPAVGSQSRRR